MATPLSEVIAVMEAQKSADVEYGSEDEAEQFARLGVTKASIGLGVEYVVDDENNIRPAMKSSHLYLAGLYAYRMYLAKQHNTLVNKAVNFKTITFAVSGMVERVREIRLVMNAVDAEIRDILRKEPTTIGAVWEIGDDYDQH